MFIGYTDEEIENGTYYIDMSMFELSWMEWYFPEDRWPEFVQAVCDYRAIHGENNLRAMMGMELLEEPENRRSIKRLRLCRPRSAETSSSTLKSRTRTRTSRGRPDRFR